MKDGNVSPDGIQREACLLLCVLYQQAASLTEFIGITVGMAIFGVPRIISAVIFVLMVIVIQLFLRYSSRERLTVSGVDTIPRNEGIYSFTLGEVSVSHP